MRIHAAHLGIGLGAACSVPLMGNPQIFQTAAGAGFPADVATQMTAIALRESAGCPTAHNPGPGEDSYGLWQINVQGNPTLLSRLGLSDPTALYDPATNARAAFMLYGGNPANLNVAWYIDQPGYAEAYQANLPAAVAAANASGAQETLADFLPADNGGASSDSSGSALDTTQAGLTGGWLWAGAAALAIGIVLLARG